MLRENKGLILLAAVVLIQFCAGFGAQGLVYKVYGSYIFPWIRLVYDYTIGFIPFGSVYLIVLLIFFFIIYRRKQRSAIVKNRIQKVILLLNALGWVFALFYITWGFNYARPSFFTTKGWSEVKPDSLKIFTELEEVSQKVKQLRTKLSADTLELQPDLFWADMEKDLRSSQILALQSLGHEVKGRVRVRPLYPKGMLMSLSTAGIYIPYTFEGHIDPGLNPIQWPFTAAHEMAHGYGYTDEGECNFIGFLTCIGSSNDHIRYSGWLGYWRYLYREAYRWSEKEADIIRLSLGAGVRADLHAIRRDIEKYPDIMPWFRDVIYEFYLKSHGMEDGLASYDGIISLVLTWKKETGN